MGRLVCAYETADRRPNRVRPRVARFIKLILPLAWLGEFRRPRLVYAGVEYLREQAAQSEVNDVSYDRRAAT
jgi:hypothetical protein